ncbi:hypothetical protein ACGF7W_26280 [Streptomyces sp. NPDC048219]|uniref:hypothetical protein n=1 Tax=Streptomyces sp. NPDC048219 TaxID=3365517 RepID=UPI0037186EC6
MTALPEQPPHPPQAVSGSACAADAAPSISTDIAPMVAPVTSPVTYVTAVREPPAVTPAQA